METSFGVFVLPPSPCPQFRFRRAGVVPRWRRRCCVRLESLGYWTGPSHGWGGPCRVAPTARRVQVPGLGWAWGLSGSRAAWPGRDLGGRPCGRERPRLTFWPRRSSYVEGPHLLRGTARGGSEHAQRFPEVATRRARETPIRRLPPSPHQDQGMRCAFSVL